LRLAVPFGTSSTYWANITSVGGGARISGVGGGASFSGDGSGQDSLLWKEEQSLPLLDHKVGFFPSYSNKLSSDEGYDMNLKDDEDATTTTLEDESPQLEWWEEAKRRAGGKEDEMLEDEVVQVENNKWYVFTILMGHFVTWHTLSTWHIAEVWCPVDWLDKRVE
jgi:hypothetical protein